MAKAKAQLAAIATALFAFGASAQQALDDPIPERIHKGDTVLRAVDFVRAPRSTDAARPGGTNNAYARIQYLLPVPAGEGERGTRRRLAFNDTRGILYLTDMEGRPLNVYLDLRRESVGFSNAAFPNEAGFMGFAFHPQFAMPGTPGYGKLFTAFSATPGSGVADYEDRDAVQDSVIREWTANDPSADAFAGTSREVFRVGQFAPNHNIGTIAFNPTAEEEDDDYGLLYICFGDGGSAHDPRDHGQTLRAPLGAIARIDPLGASGGSYGIPPNNPFVGQANAAPEIWAYGLRHPQQFSWDVDGRMFIADIGQDQIEEINLGRAGGNYGWRLREGTFATAHGVGRGGRGPVFPLPADDPASFLYPIAQYDHDEGNAVGGGYVYRGADAALHGKYVFTEFVRGRLLAIDAAGVRQGMQVPIEELRLTFDGEEQDLVDVAGFFNPYTGGRRVDARLGIDHDGELYLLTKGDGWIRKLVGQSPPMTENAHRVPLFLAASRAPQQQGFVRIVNHADMAGTVRVAALDDAGRRFGPIAIEMAAKETKHFNSDDLEMGNAAKGLATGTGTGTGDWRLEMTSRLPLEVLAYVRTQDGFLTSMHDTVRQPGPRHLVPIFNPASNANQVSSLRITNRRGDDASVAIVGVDDRGRQTTAVRLQLPAGETRTLSSQQLEGGDAALEGALGDGRGKWRLYVWADQPLAVMSLLESPTGHLTNLSTSTTDADFPLPSDATADDAPSRDLRIALMPSASHATRQGFVRIVNHTPSAGTVTIRAIDDRGMASDSLSLALAPWQARHFNSDDLENGNAAKGIPTGTGAGSGDWRLELESDVDIEALAYIRTLDGFLTSVHDTARMEGQWHVLPTFNPGSNQDQASRLRLVNRSDSDVAVTVVGRDDRGAQSPPMRFSLAAANVREISARELETEGFGDGAGKWYLFVSAGALVDAMGLLESASGHLTNLSTSMASGATPPAASSPRHGLAAGHGTHR